jgi:ribosome biogenesis GTPase / thiamine phosphate phosphatase
LNLEALGWDASFAAAFEPHNSSELIPGRVGVQHRGAWVVLTELGELRSDVSGRLAREAEPGELPAVGDWVAVAPRTDEGRGTIHAVLPRRTKFSRKAATGPSDRTEEQVVAANVDTVFLVSALGLDVNARRLERYLTTAWESGAEPVIVLTKSDLHPDLVPAALVEVDPIAFGVPVHVLSGVTGEGVDALEPYLTHGRTIALLGSSGVGKSTLVNHLAGREVLATREVRASDERGRHTTSHRELVPLPAGALLLDTPGMRELQLWDASDGLAGAFEDVERVIPLCRFSDCSHDTEPGCAVRAALADGSLDPDRWESYRKLERELHWLEVRQNARLASDQRKKWRAMARSRRKVSY